MHNALWQWEEKLQPHLHKHDLYRALYRAGIHHWHWPHIAQQQYEAWKKQEAYNIAADYVINNQLQLHGISPRE